MSALDTEYFRRKMELIIRDLSHYKPQEMARELVRLAKVADESETSKEAAQATPEGAELPNCDERFEEAWPRIHAHGAENGWRGIALAAWKERGALAATTAAEPVVYVRLRDIDGTFTGDMVMGFRTPGSDWNVALYRAAPPQQVGTSGLPG